MFHVHVDYPFSFVLPGKLLNVKMLFNVNASLPKSSTVLDNKDEQDSCLLKRKLEASSLEYTSKLGIIT